MKSRRCILSYNSTLTQVDCVMVRVNHLPPMQSPDLLRTVAYRQPT